MRSSLTGILAFILAAGLFVALSYAPPDGFADAELHDAPPGSHEAPAPRAPEALSTTRVGARATSNEPITFATLDGDQEIVIEFERRWCTMNQDRYRFVFSRKDSLSVSVRFLSKSFEPVDEDLGERSLTDEDARGLDGLIGYYREVNGIEASTSISEIEVEYHEGGRPVAAESFVDRTFTADERPGVMTLMQIVNDLQVRRAAERKASGAKD